LPFLTEIIGKQVQLKVSMQQAAQNQDLVGQQGP